MSGSQASYLIATTMILGLATSASASMPVAVRAIPNRPFTLARVDRCFFAPPPAGTVGWPLAPLHRAHGIRGSFNGVRGSSPHYGADVEAVRNGAPVYAVAAGTVTRHRPGVRHFSIRTPGAGHSILYDHVIPAPGIATGAWVSSGRLIGHIVPAYYHVHVSELDAACGWVDPMRPTGPLHVAQNTEAPTIEPLHAFAANAAAFRRFDTSRNPAHEVNPATPMPLTSLHGVVDLRAEIHDWPRRLMVDRPQLELEVAAIRSYLAPVSDRHAHVSRMKMIFDGATLLDPARHGTTIWHIWAFGTWRNSAGYFQKGPGARVNLGTAYVWHVGGITGLHTGRYPNGKYLYCVQALTDNGVRATRCTPVVIDNP
jgi:hypothetical protein